MKLFKTIFVVNFNDIATYTLTYLQSPPGVIVVSERGVAVQYDALDMLTGVIGGVVRGSRVYLVHLACMCSIGIWHGSVKPGRSRGLCRGSSLLRDINVIVYI